MDRTHEGLQTLGKKTEYRMDYAPEVLETFENKHKGNDYWVQFNCPEFTSLCPITFNYYPIANCGLAIKAGVQVGFTMRKRMTLDGVDYNADETATWVRKTWVNRWTGRAFPVAVENELSRKFNKVDCSIPLAVSYEYKSFQLEARYNLGLTKVMKEDPESSKHSVFLFTLGYKINLDND